MAFDFNSFGSSTGTTATKPKVGGFSFDSFGQQAAPTAEEKKKNANLGTFIAKDIQGKATEEDHPGGVSGFLADLYQGTLGSGGLSGLAQAPVRPIATAVGAGAVEDIQKNRLKLAETADHFIAMASSEKDPAKKKKLLSLASQTLKQGEGLQAESDKVMSNTPQSTSIGGDIERVAGQALNTALTVAPFAKGAQAAQVLRQPTLGSRVLSGVKEGAKYGAGFGAGGALSEEKSAGDVAKGTVFGGLTGAAIGGAIPLAVEGISRTASKIGQRSADKAAKAAEQVSMLEGSVPDARVATKTLKNGKVVTDKVAKEVVKQGVPEADVALVKSSTPADQTKMLKMLETRVAQKTNSRLTARASDIPGNTFVDQIVKPLQETNKKAGQQLDLVAQKLAGQKVNAQPAVQDLASRLESAGVKISRDGKVLKFKGSDFEGIRGAQSALQNVWNRAIRVAKTGDALQLHRTKRFIDEVVNYGKATEGLSGRAESLLKGFRKAADGVLDTQFPAYNKANTVFAETIGELDKIAQSMGRNFRAGDSFADAKAGVVLRRLFSNTQSRAQLLQTLESAQTIAKKYGANINEDVIAQAKFADTLESLLGSEAPTSLQGIGEKVVGHAERGAQAVAEAARGGTGLISGGAKLVHHVADIARGVNEENLIKALRQLLSEGAKKSTTLGRAVGK